MFHAAWLWKGFGGYARPSDLLLVQHSLVCVALWCSVLPLRAIKLALDPSSGTLARLGAGAQEVDAGSATRLGRWRVLLSLNAGSFFAAMLLFGLAVPLGMPAVFGSTIGPVQWVNWTAGWPWGTLNLCWLDGCVFWLTMKMAAVLARPRIQAVIESVRRTDASDEEEWRARVTRPALELDALMGTLTATWGTGLGGFALTCWIFAGGLFAGLLDAEFTAGWDVMTRHLGVGVPDGTWRAVVM
eukprot:SAG22_NODE_170_length_16713_cov_33.746298_9_plen_243_part_00